MWLSTDDAIATKSANIFAIANTFRFLEFGACNVFIGKTTQISKTSLGGRGGKLLSERQTTASAAHMNGIRGDPSTAPLYTVANDNGHS